MKRDFKRGRDEINDARREGGRGGRENLYKQRVHVRSEMRRINSNPRSDLWG